MKQEYDFSKGERGKFFHGNSKLNLPAHLNEEAQNSLQKRVGPKGAEAPQLVDETPRKNIK